MESRLCNLISVSKQSSEGGFSLRKGKARKGLVYLRVSVMRAAGKTVISGKNQVSFGARRLRKMRRGELGVRKLM